MFDPFNKKKIKQLEDKINKLEKRIDNYESIFRKLSIALKGNYDLIKSVININSKH